MYLFSQHTYYILNKNSINKFCQFLKLTHMPYLPLYISTGLCSHMYFWITGIGNVSKQSGFYTTHASVYK